MAKSSHSTRARIFASASAVAMGLSLLGAGGAAWAQDADDEDEDEDRVVVTGSRIQRQDFTANSPIVTVDTDTFEETSTIGIETVLNQLPQFIPAATTETGGSQFSSGSLEGNSLQTPGASSVNLRGLGSGRNLVLVDGRRAMAVNASGVVDTNSIPSSAVERVEIISGGASAVYGADAIAGVVNFILKDDFEGFDVDFNYGMTEIGDGEEFRTSALFGVNSADGRGNVMLGMEHATRSAASNNERDWYISDRLEPDTGGNDFWFQETWVDIGFGNQPSQAAVDGAFADNGVAPGAIPTFPLRIFANPGSDNVFSGGRNIFGSNGSAGIVAYEGPIECFDPGCVEYRGDFPYRVVTTDGFIKQNQELNNITVPLNRYSMFGRGRYELTDSITAFGRANFARTRTSTLQQPASAITINDARVPFGSEIYGPSLGDSAITGYDPVTGEPIYDPTAPTLAAYVAGGGFGLNCPATGGCTESQAFPVPQELQDILNSRPNPNEDIDVQRSTDFFGYRTTNSNTTTFQLLLGLEGELPNDWIWDVALSHGQTQVTTRYGGFLSMERYRAIANWPNFGRGFVATANQQEGGVRGGTGTCTSGIPFFDDFEVSQDCLDAIDTQMKQTGELEQNIFEANLTGDLFELPAGPIGFAVGGTYRENDYVFKADGINAPSTFNDSVIGLAPTGNTDAFVSVREIYGELLIPIVSDGPIGMRGLNLELGGRYSDYDSSGGVETFKILGDWLVTDWARLRGGYNRASRAPNIAEQFLGRTLLVFSTTGTRGDPCSLNNYESPFSAATGPSGTGVAAPASPEQAAATRSICESLMGASADAFYAQPVDEMTEGTGGIGNAIFVGNPDVNPETANTFTAGLVLTSPFDNPWLSGFRATVDYYRIELEDIISDESGDLVQERCFLLENNPTADPNNEFCQRIQRDISDGGTLSLDITKTNEGSATLSGVDLQLNWAGQFDELGMDMIPGGVGVNMLATIPIEFETIVTDGATPIDWVGTQGGSCLGLNCGTYDYQIFTTFNYFVGPFSASLRWSHYPSIESGALATNPASTARGVPEAYNIFALTGNYRFNEQFTIRAGVENLFDKVPPRSGGDPNSTTPSGRFATRSGGGIYDPLGRRFFIGGRATF